MILAEPIVSGLEHAPFNAGLTQVVDAAGADRIAWRGESTHLDAILAALPPTLAARIETAPLALPPRQLKSQQRVRLDAVMAWRLLRHASATGGTHVILTSLSPGTVLGAKLALATLPWRRRPKVFVVCHSVLSEVWSWRSPNPVRRVIDMAGALRWPAPAGFHVVVLEAAIADALRQKLPAVAPQIVLLQHPIAEELAVPARRRPGPLRVGFLGAATMAKGFDQFCALASEVRARGVDVEFRAVGKAVAGAVGAAAMADLAQRPATVPLGRADYLAQLLDLDLVAMLHTAQVYSYVASGVLLDALAAERPMLHLPNPLVDSLARRYGPFGPRVDDLTAAASLLAELDVAALDGPDFVAYRANLRAGAAARRPTALAESFARYLA